MNIVTTRQDKQARDAAARARQQAAERDMRAAGSGTAAVRAAQSTQAGASVTAGSMSRTSRAATGLGGVADMTQSVVGGVRASAAENKGPPSMGSSRLSSSQMGGHDSVPGGGKGAQGVYTLNFAVPVGLAPPKPAFGRALDSSAVGAQHGALPARRRSESKAQ